MSTTAAVPDVYIRSRFEEFCVFRRAAKRQQQWLSRQDTDGSPAVGSSNSGAPHAASDGQSTAAQPSPPSWVQILVKCRDAEEMIQNKFAKIHALEQEFFSPKFVSLDEEAEEQAAIQKLRGELQKHLKEFDRLVKVEIRPDNPQSSADENFCAKNVQRHLSARLTSLLTIFRDSEQLFADQLRLRDAKVKKFKQVGSQDAQQRLDREEKVETYLSLGFTQADIAELLLEEERQVDMSREVENIVASLKELQEMFVDLKSLVVEQGTMLDRIDHNISRTRDNLALGNKDLTKAREHQKTCCFA